MTAYFSIKKQQSMKTTLFGGGEDPSDNSTCKTWNSEILNMCVYTQLLGREGEG